jgi:hypothetical protein
MRLILSCTVAEVEEGNEHSGNNRAGKPVPVLTDNGDDPLKIDATFFFGLLLRSMVEVFLHDNDFSPYGRSSRDCKDVRVFKLFNVR